MTRSFGNKEIGRILSSGTTSELAALLLHPDEKIRERAKRSYQKITGALPLPELFEEKHNLDMSALQKFLSEKL